MSDWLHRAGPWLILVPGYILGFMAIPDYWPQGEEPPLLVGWGLLVWIVGYPAALSVLADRAGDRARTEQRLERYEDETQ